MSFGASKTLLTGGTSAALDSINGNTITDGDVQLVFTATNKLYVYTANAAGGEGESAPLIIVPDTNPGSINWELQVIHGCNKILVVSDIDDPSTELNALSGEYVGSTILCYQANAGDNEWTLYAWDNSSSDSENVPYTVDGSSGAWIAIAGKYFDAIHGSTHISGARDEIDGDKLDIDFAPAHYDRNTSISEASSNNHLSAHLKGIDDKINSPIIIDYWT